MKQKFSEQRHCNLQDDMYSPLGPVKMKLNIAF